MTLTVVTSKGGNATEIIIEIADIGSHRQFPNPFLIHLLLSKRRILATHLAIW